MDSTKLHEMQQLVRGAQHAVAVVGAGSDFELIPLVPIDSDKTDAEVVADAQQRGFVFCGVLGLLRDGSAAAKCADIDSIPTMIRAAERFAEEAAQRLMCRAAGDSAAWLERLYQLQDPRARLEN
jgi:hypothetical protein